MILRERSVMSACLAELQVEEYLAGLLSDQAKTELDRHLAVCPACVKAVESARADHFLWNEIGSAVRANPRPPSQPASSGHAVDQRNRPLELAGYEVLRELHRGGQGIVYEAVQSATKRKVAVKVLLSGARASQRQQRRFEREIDLVANLQHPNIVTLYESGICDGMPYFAMQYVLGLPLHQYLNKRSHQESSGTASPKRPVTDTLRLFHKICLAVSYAHQHGVIHRDLKPGNILVDEEGEPHVVDFGLAQVTDESANALSRATLTGEFVGTLAYASPEQAAADPSQVDVRTDVYSLGVILFEMLTGELPYDISGSISETLRRIREDEPHSPSVLRPDVDYEVSTIVLKALEKDPSRRYQSAEHLARDVGHYMAGDPIDAKRASTLYVLRKTLRRHRLAVAGILSLVTVITISFLVSVGFWRQAVLDRDDAYRAKTAESEARSDAERQRDAAQFQAYLANVSAGNAAIRAHDVTEARRRLELAPVQYRDWEWLHLRGRLDGARLVLRGHREYVENVAVCRHTPIAISAAWDKSVRFWNSESGRELKSIELPTHAWSVAIDPEEKHVAVGAWDGRVRIYTIPDGRLVDDWEGPTKRVPAVAFHPDGKHLVAGFAAFDEPRSANAVLVYDLAKREIIRQLPQRGYIQSLAIRPDGKQLATADYQGVTIWDDESGQRVSEISGRQAVAWSPDSKRLATGDDRHVIVVRDLNGGTPDVVLRGHTGQVFSVAFSFDGLRLASASRDKTVRLWNVANGEQLAVYLGHTWTVTSVAFLGPERLISSSWDATLRIWDTTQQQAVQSLNAHSEAITAVTFSVTGSRLATASRDSTVRIWNAKSRTLETTLKGHQEAVQAVGFAPDQVRVASASWDRTVRLWNLDDPANVQVLEGHTDRVHAVAFSQHGDWLVSGSRDNTLRIWDTKTGRELSVLQGHDDHIHCAAMSPDGKCFASAGHRTVKLWDAATRQQIASFPRTIIQDDFSLAFDPKGRMLAAGSDIDTLGLWDVEARKPLDSLDGHTDEIHSVSFSPDGRRLVSAAFDGTVKLWDVPHRLVLATLDGYSGHVNCVTFSPDGGTIVGGTNRGELIFWEAEGETTTKYTKDTKQEGKSKRTD
jgi:WD40 repeat protein/serine/threonine protein kinase